MSLNICILCVLVMLESGAGGAVDRKRNVESTVDEELDNNGHHDQDGNVERRMLEVLGLFDNNDFGYETESHLSIYESIKDEKSSILTKIERLYNAFKSHPVHQDQDHEFPLLTIDSSEPHSVTIKIQTRHLQPDTMVSNQL